MTIIKTIMKSSFWKNITTVFPYELILTGKLREGKAGIPDGTSSTGWQQRTPSRIWEITARCLHYSGLIDFPSACADLDPRKLHLQTLSTIYFSKIVLQLYFLLIEEFLGKSILNTARK